MSRLIDLTGQTFGRLTVIKRVKDHKRGSGRRDVMWECVCSCGAIVTVRGEHLRNGHIRSCGCLRREVTSNRMSKIISNGSVFGKLTVIGESLGNKVGSGEKYYICVCECGNIVEVKGVSLRNGNTKSCGCFQKERASEVNKHDLTGQVFGRLIVIKQAKSCGRIKWLCQCSCGEFVVVRAHDLMTGNTQSCGCYHRDMVSGANNYNWRGGIAPIKNVIQETREYKDFRQKVFERDAFACRFSGQLRGNIQVHHINSFDKYPEERLDVDNGITLSEEWHIGVKTDNPYAFHRMYGTRSFTKQDFKEWFLAITPEFSKELGWVS